jgi:hypothetical protein
MDRAEAEQLHHSLRTEFEQIVDQLTRLTERRDALLQVMSGLETLFPEMRAGTTENEPLELKSPPPRVIRDGLELIFREDEGETWFTTGNLVEELRNHGWLPESSDPESAVRAALRRLLERGVVARRKLNGRTLQYTLDIPQHAPQPVDGLPVDTLGPVP